MWPGPSFMTCTPFGPGALGQVALHFELGELRFVVRVGDGAGAEPVTNTEADVVGRHDVADIVPMFIQEALLVMGEAPFRHDGAAAADDAGHAPRGERDEAQQDAGVDGEVIDALLGLLDERVAEDFPSQVFGAAVHFLKGLVDGDGADRHGRVADNPFARRVDVFAGAEVHHGVGAPFGGPTHFLNFFLDRGGDGAVADVGVDFDQEIAADDHRLELGMVDVGRDDGTAAGDFGTDEFGGDFGGNRGAKALARVLVGQCVPFRSMK